MSFSDFIEHEINSDFVVDPFSIQYLIFILIGILSVVLTLFFAKKIKAWKYEKKLKIMMGFALIVLETIYHIHNYVNGVFSIPLHISSFCVLFSIYVLFTDNRRIFGMLYYLGILGGLAAFFAPGMLNYTFYHIRFYHFILVHVAIIIVPLYYYKAYDYKINIKDMMITYVALIIILPYVIYVNYILERNYMFIGELPSQFVGVFPVWPYYIIVYLVLLIIPFAILYYLTNYYDVLINKLKNRK